VVVEVWVVIIAGAATANSNWSRGPVYECRIGDLMHAEAMEYLSVKREIDSHKAVKIIDFCGPRISVRAMSLKRELILIVCPPSRLLACFLR